MLIAFTALNPQQPSRIATLHKQSWGNKKGKINKYVGQRIGECWCQDICQTCCDKLALVRVVHNRLEECVGKEAAAAGKGGHVPNDAAAVAAGSHKVVSTAGLHQNGVHSTFMLLQTFPTVAHILVTT